MSGNHQRSNDLDLTQKTDLVLVRQLIAPSSSKKFVLGADFQIGNWTVPAGFTTDLASVPFGLRNVVSRFDGIEAATLHDWFYRRGRLPRHMADEIFFTMLEGAVPNWKRRLMYWAVRLGGRFAYNCAPS